MNSNTENKKMDLILKESDLQLNRALEAIQELFDGNSRLLKALNQANPEIADLRKIIEETAYNAMAKLQGAPRKS